MPYALTRTELISVQAQRVFSVITMETIKKGYATLQEIHDHFDIPNDQLIEVRDLLLAQGTIEVV